MQEFIPRVSTICKCIRILHVYIQRVRIIMEKFITTVSVMKEKLKIIQFKYRYEKKTKN